MIMSILRGNARRAAALMFCLALAFILVLFSPARKSPQIMMADQGSRGRGGSPVDTKHGARTSVDTAGAEAEDSTLLTSFLQDDYRDDDGGGGGGRRVTDARKPLSSATATTATSSSLLTTLQNFGRPFHGRPTPPRREVVKPTTARDKINHLVSSIITQNSAATAATAQTQPAPQIVPPANADAAAASVDADTTVRVRQAELRKLFGVTTINDIMIENVMPYSKADDGDSLAMATVRDTHRYFLCSFTNVCINSTNWMITVADLTHRELFNALRQECFAVGSKLRMPVCKCFNHEMPPVFISPEDHAHLPRASGHHWVVDTWVRSHQISHWAEKLVLTHSIFEHDTEYGLPSINGVTFPKYTLPLSDHEAHILELSLSKIFERTTNPSLIFRQELDQMHGICYDRLSVPPTNAVVAYSLDDAQAFRRRAYKHFDLPVLACPPRRVGLLHRVDHPERSRRILNMDEVRQALRDEGIQFAMEEYRMGATNSSFQQAQLFAKVGLLISSHSSQLINCLFSQEHAAIIEVTPAFHNNDFGAIARQTGTFFAFAIGGNTDSVGPPLESQTELVKVCQRTYLACNTNATCIEEVYTSEQGKPCRGIGSDYFKWAKSNKHLNFNANITALRQAVRNAVVTLSQICGSDWRTGAPDVPLDVMSTTNHIRTTTRKNVWLQEQVHTESNTANRSLYR